MRKNKVKTKKYDIFNGIDDCEIIEFFLDELKEDCIGKHYHMLLSAKESLINIKTYFLDKR